ncbi:response regulator [Campylobacterota bacterium DY0563]
MIYLSIMNDFNILIIEDESLIAYKIKKILECENYNIVGIAKDSSKAIHLIQENDVNLIIADITILGFLNGIETVKLIQEGFSIPVIFLTAHQEEKFLKEASQVNYLGYLVKPFIEEDLIREVKLAYYHIKNKSEKNIIQLSDDYNYCIGTSVLKNKSEVIVLGKKEKCFFNILVLNKNNLVSNELVDLLLWNDKIIDDATRRQVLFRLRKKVPELDIETIKGEGYILKV